MQPMLRNGIALIVMVTGCGCAGTGPVMAPGAAEVKITKHPDDVAGCTPVGNIDSDLMFSIYAVQNKAVGYNGNVVLNAAGGLIAYRCGKAPATAQ